MDTRLLSKLDLCSQIGGPNTAIILVKPDLTILSWNEGAEHIYGWPEDEVIGRSLPDILQTEYLEERSQTSALVDLMEKGSWQSEVRQKHRDGSSLLVDASVSLVRDDAGEVCGYVGVNRNVTGQRAVELELERTAHLLAAIVDSVPVIVCRLDATGSIRDCTGSGLTTHGLQAKDLIDTSITALSQNAADHLGAAAGGDWVAFDDKIDLPSGIRAARHTLCPDQLHDDGLVSIIDLSS